MIEQPIFLCNSNPTGLLELFVDTLDGLATQSKAQTNLKFLRNETSVKSKLNQIFSNLNQRRSRKNQYSNLKMSVSKTKKKKSTMMC